MGKYPDPITLEALTFRFKGGNRCRGSVYWARANPLHSLGLLEHDPKTGFSLVRETPEHGDQAEARVHAQCQTAQGNNGWWIGYSSRYSLEPIIYICRCQKCDHPPFDLDAFIEGEGIGLVNMHEDSGRRSQERAYWDKIEQAGPMLLDALMDLLENHGAPQTELVKKAVAKAAGKEISGE